MSGIKTKTGIGIVHKSRGELKVFSSSSTYRVERGKDTHNRLAWNVYDSDGNWVYSNPLQNRCLRWIQKNSQKLEEQC